MELQVAYEKLNAFFADYTRNISKGGTFIPSRRSAPARHRLPLPAAWSRGGRSPSSSRGWWSATGTTATSPAWGSSSAGATRSGAAQFEAGGRGHDDRAASARSWRGNCSTVAARAITDGLGRVPSTRIRSPTRTPCAPAQPPGTSSTIRLGPPMRGSRVRGRARATMPVTRPDGVDEDQVEGDEGVLHPEGVLPLLVEEEEHAVAVRQLLAKHEPSLAFLRGVGELHLDDVGLAARLEDGPRAHRRRRRRGPRRARGRRGPRRRPAGRYRPSRCWNCRAWPLTVSTRAAPLQGACFPRSRNCPGRR